MDINDKAYLTGDWTESIVFRIFLTRLGLLQFF